MKAGGRIESTFNSNGANGDDKTIFLCMVQNANSVYNGFASYGTNVTFPIIGGFGSNPNKALGATIQGKGNLGFYNGPGALIHIDGMVEWEGTTYNKTYPYNIPAFYSNAARCTRPECNHGGVATYLDLTSPSNNSIFTAGDNVTIRWNDDGVGNVTVRYYKNGSWNYPIATNISNTGSCSWTAVEGADTLQVYAISNPSGLNDKHNITVNSAGPTYTLTVTSGSGDGEYEKGDAATITADEAPIGKVFDKWTGDISYLGDATKSPTTVTMPGMDISVMATYKDDDVIISDNFVLIASWEGNVDEHGLSSIDVDTSKVQSDTLMTTKFDLGTSDYAWAKVTGSVDGDFSKVTGVKLTYTSNKAVSIELEQENLSAFGSNYMDTLAAGTDVTVTIPIGDFAQPKWVEDEVEAKGDLDLAKVDGISFSAMIAVDGSTNFSLKGVFVYGYEEGTAISSNNMLSGKEQNTIMITRFTSSQLAISNIASGHYDISIFNVMGKNLFSVKRELSSNTIVDFGKNSLTPGSYIVRINGTAGSFTTKRINN